MTTHELIQVLNLMPTDTVVMLHNPDWSYRDKDCVINSVTVGSNSVELNFIGVDKPVEEDEVEDNESC